MIYWKHLYWIVRTCGFDIALTAFRSDPEQNVPAAPCTMRPFPSVQLSSSHTRSSSSIIMLPGKQTACLKTLNNLRVGNWNHTTLFTWEGIHSWWIIDRHQCNAWLLFLKIYGSSRKQPQLQPNLLLLGDIGFTAKCLLALKKTSRSTLCVLE